MYRTILIGVLTACLIGGGVVSAADHTVSVDGAMEIPERTVAVGGESYHVSSLARVPRGEQIRAQTSGASDAGYRVYLHSADGTVVDQQYVAVAADGTVTFDTSTYAAGSYVLSVYEDGTYYDPHPVVIPAYDVAIDTPEAGLDSDEDSNISVALTERESGHAVQQVMVVISNVTTTQRYPASQVNGAYVVELDAVQLTPGSYSVYAVVVTENDAPGPSNEVIGISDNSQIELETRSAGARESESSETDDKHENENTTLSANSTPSNKSNTTVITPELPANETAEGASTDDDVGGTPFAILSLAVVVCLLVLSGSRG
jgi:hypothetical protein